MNETALKERLKVVAAQKNTTINKIWKQLLLERFLAKLSGSYYQNKLIFKGGLLLAQYIAINRETIDIDFLMTNIQNQIQKVEIVIKEIAAITTDDGFLFSWDSIEELTQPHMEYLGFRVTLNAQFGKMHDKIQIDIGVGDAVDPIEMSYDLFEYKGNPIFVGEITLLVYPPETIFAEKLETILSKGVINSRMKDYHDVLIMLRESDFMAIDKLRDTIQVTFNRRGTKKIPIQFDETGMQRLDSHWSRHLRGLGTFKEQLRLPKNIGDVINEINNWIASNKLFSDVD